jgi:hypothetical protein
MKRCLIISALPGLLALVVTCSDDQGRFNSKPAPAANIYSVAPLRKEVIAQRVLAVQLAPHDQFEATNMFAQNEPIPASLYLASSGYVEPRRILAFLISDEAIVEQQSISIRADDRQEEFDFRFTKTPRPPGTYQIRLVEIARSNAKPVLLARLFLTVE